MNDKKKVVWITGASSGIGKAITELFVKNGIFVIATARKIELLEEIKTNLGKPENLTVHQLDVTSAPDISTFYTSVSPDYEIDCLINNAGVTSFKKTVDDSITDIEQIIHTNLLGSIYTIKEVLPGMISCTSGTIINILSVVTKKIFTSSSAYSASKSGLLAYTNVLREEVRDKNIRIVNISPGATNTNIWPAGTRSKYSERMMNADAIAELVLHVYSEKSNLVAEDIVLRPITGDL
jgi:NADP-dependent 3-hydroxy acid dehydrogenase YdfG